MFKRNKKPQGFSKTVILVFLVLLTLCSFAIYATIENRARNEELLMEQIILDKTFRINQAISRLLYKTEALAVIAGHSDGSFRNFYDMAPFIVDDPAILNILLAPDGVVEHIFSYYDGQEGVLGLNFFEEGDGNREAIMAKELKQLVMGGPFESLQGGYVLAGRRAVFLDLPDGSEEFWGIVSVTLRFPQALDNVGLGILENQEYVYELWRMNPDTNEKQVIASSDKKPGRGSKSIEKHVSVINAEWYLRISYGGAWYSYPENLFVAAAGLFISLLVLTILQHNQKLNRMKSKLESIANSDALTGIHNRRYFMETARRDIERAARKKSGAFIIIFDIDHFKKVNDSYGHSAGDEVLRNFASTVKKAIRPYDLFARYGGEEFIILACDIEKANILILAERIRTAIAQNPAEFDGNTISVTASFGIAYTASVSDFEGSIDFADKALYQAKREGRNRAIFYEPE